MPHDFCYDPPMKKLILVMVAAVCLTALPVGVAATTQSSTSCKTDVAQLSDHPDSGSKGNTWADDYFTRTVTICEVGTTNAYHATVKDSGTFTTIAGVDSPGSGPAKIAGVVTGSMAGGFTADFTAAPGFATYTAKHGSTTSTWVQGYFSDFAGSSINDDWSWSYLTPCEKWVDAASNGAGGNPADGNIVGKTCPTPSPAPTATPKPSGNPPAAPPPPHAAPPAPAPQPPGLPDTGHPPTH